MKRTIIISLLAFLVSTMAYTQEEGELQYYKEKEIKTLLGKERHRGKYGAISMGISGVDGRTTLLFGQKVTWLPVNMLGIGMGLNEFISEYRHDDVSGRDIYLTGGFGGMYIEPIILPRMPVHASFPVLLGFGGLSQLYGDDDFMVTDMFREFQTFLVIEPGAEIELNLTKSFRLAAGITYRFTTPFEIRSPGSYTTDIESLRSLSFKLMFKFGRF